VALSQSTKKEHGNLFQFYFFQLAFGHGCDCPGYVNFRLNQFDFVSTLLVDNGGQQKIQWPLVCLPLP
jgi:hypothetical protein